LYQPQQQQQDGHHLTALAESGSEYQIDPQESVKEQKDEEK
jgi:hypothetical protein